jgi:hypothetical protein
MSKDPKTRTLRSYLPVICGILVVGGVVCLVSGWLSYRHVPEWYRPVYVAPEDEQDARDELGAAFTELSRGMGRGMPFEFVVHQDQLNRWLVGRDRIWPASKRWIPEQISDPMIVFDRGEVLIAGLWCGPGPQTVVNIRLRLEMNGGVLRSVVKGVRGGALPVPMAPIKAELARLEARWAERREPLLPDAGSIVGALEGAALPREIPWSQPRGKFEIEALEVRPKELFVRLRPVPRAARERGEGGAR